MKFRLNAYSENQINIKHTINLYKHMIQKKPTYTKYTKIYKRIVAVASKFCSKFGEKKIVHFSKNSCTGGICLNKFYSPMSNFHKKIVVIVRESNLLNKKYFFISLQVAELFPIEATVKNVSWKPYSMHHTVNNTNVQNSLSEK